MIKRFKRLPDGKLVEVQERTLNQPTTFRTQPRQFQQPIQTQPMNRPTGIERGTIMSLFLGDEGGDIIDKMQLNMPCLETGQVGDYIFPAHTFPLKNFEHRRKMRKR